MAGKGGGGGRAPCCDKSKVKKGPWSPAEDATLVSFIHKHGHPNWRSLPKQAGLLRCGKSCRLRWINYLRPDVKRGNFTPQEEQSIIHLHTIYGNKWSKIASELPGRTDNEIKNVWNTHLKKKSLLLMNNNGKKNETSLGTMAASPALPSSSSASSNVSNGTQHQDIDQIGFHTQQNSSSLPKQQMYDSNQNDQVQRPKLIVDEQVGAVTKDQPSSPCSIISCSCESSSPMQAKDWKRKTEGYLHQVDHDDISNTNNNNDSILEIPLESEVEFWNMLDELQPIINCPDELLLEPSFSFSFWSSIQAANDG